MSLGGNLRFAQPSDQGADNNAYQPLPQFTGNDPYSQIMAMMPAFKNPYENFAPGTALGGFDPNLYTRAIQDINGNLYGNNDGTGGMPGGDSSPSTGMGDGGISGGGGGGAATDGGEGFAAANPGDFGDTSSVSDGEGSVGDGGVSGGGGGGAADGGDGGAAGWAMGGLIDRVGGPNPPGPDDGTGYLDLGEYVIRKSSVKKYGRGLLNMINEGKVPAKKIKSLLD